MCDGLGTHRSCFGKSSAIFGSSMISLTEMSPPRPECNLYVVVYGFLKRGRRLGCSIFWFLLWIVGSDWDRCWLMLEAMALSSWPWEGVDLADPGPASSSDDQEQMVTNPATRPSCASSFNRTWPWYDKQWVFNLLISKRIPELERFSSDVTAEPMVVLVMVSLSLMSWTLTRT